jgi:glycosyltransferase involved in cell wall biosynthesis
MTALKPGVSIIVCCHNGQARIRRCLGYVFQLKKPDGDLPIEVILVDNRSTDSTVEIAMAAAGSYCTHPLRIIREERKGVAFARESGILSARYEVLVFCDDDNLLDSEYAKVAWQVLQDHPTVAIVGGNSVAECEIDLPVWFDELSGQYAVQSVDYSGPIQEGANHWTAGMVARTEVLQQVTRSGFRPIGSTGLPGFSGSCGEDTELCLAVRYWKWKLYYEGRLIFTHVIPPDRLTRQFLVQQARNFGAASLATDANRLLNKDDWRNVIRLNIWYQIIRAFFALIAAAPARFREDPKSHRLSAWHARWGRLRALWLNRACYKTIVSDYREWYLNNKPQDLSQPSIAPAYLPKH